MGFPTQARISPIFISSRRQDKIAVIFDYRHVVLRPALLVTEPFASCVRTAVHGRCCVSRNARHRSFHKGPQHERFAVFPSHVLEA